MVFPRLSTNELKDLKKQFIDFLILNGIDAKDWEKVQKKDKDMANEILDQFSQVIWTGEMRKVQYLLRIEKHGIKAIRCLPNKFTLVALEVDDSINLQLKFDMNQIIDSKPKVYTTERAHPTSVEEEVFLMLQQGFVKDDGEWFRKLIALL